MADILNIPNSGATGSGNSGVDSNDLKRKTLKGIILTDPDVEFSAADRVDLDTFMEALETATTAARGSRIFPIPDLVNFEDNSSEATQGSLGNLVNTQIDLVDAVPSFLFRHYKGEAYHKKLSRFNSQSVRIFIFDDQFALYGHKDSDGNFKGYTMSQFRTQLAKFGTTSDSGQYPFRVVLESASEYRENSAYVVCDSRLSALSGLIDVVLSVFSHSTNVVKIAANAEGSGTNIIELFNGELDAAGAWVVKNHQTGVAFTVTSYAYDSTNKVITITLDSTAYTALTSTHKVSFNLESAAALAALNVSPYESTGLVTVTKA